jgi:hypothetical protein
VDLVRGQASSEPLPGSAQMRELALSTLSALEHAKLGDAVRALHDRVFGCSVETLLEPYEENNAWRWRFKPMAELLLRELKQLAKAEHIPLAERRRRIEWALEMAGF